MTDTPKIRVLLVRRHVEAINWARKNGYMPEHVVNTDDPTSYHRLLGLEIAMDEWTATDLAGTGRYSGRIQRELLDRVRRGMKAREESVS